jgi:hypothetical protein
MSYFAIDSLNKSVLNSFDFARFRFGAVLRIAPEIAAKQNLFTTEGAEDTEKIGKSGHWDIGTSENQNLPRINADERGLDNSRNPIDWKPTADMYSMDTREGMEAYEATFLSHLRGAPHRSLSLGTTWDAMGPSGMNIGVGGGVGRKLPVSPGVPKIAEIEKQRLKP